MFAQIHRGQCWGRGPPGGEAGGRWRGNSRMESLKPSGLQCWWAASIACFDASLLVHVLRGMRSFVMSKPVLLICFIHIRATVCSPAGLAAALEGSGDELDGALHSRLRHLRRSIGSVGPGGVLKLRTLVEVQVDITDGGRERSHPRGIFSTMPMTALWAAQPLLSNSTRASETVCEVQWNQWNIQHSGETLDSTQ